MPTKKTIGIALASYQPQAEVLAAQLASLTAQTHTDWVCRITLDSPLAGLRQEGALEPYFADSRFEWSENPVRLGHAKNFEKAMRLCLEQNVAAIAFCDQDDIWHPEKLARSFEVLEKSPPQAMVHCDLIPFWGEPPTHYEGATVWSLERRQVESPTPSELAVRCVVNGTAALFSADLARSCPPFSPEVAHHDQWLAILAASRGGVFPIHQPLVLYRQHEKNVSGLNPDRGWFKLPLGQALKRIRTRWQEYQTLKTALETAFPAIPLLEPRELFLVSIQSFKSDPVLSRASLAKWLGSWLPT
jgi:hypothetical protein